VEAPGGRDPVGGERGGEGGEHMGEPIVSFSSLASLLVVLNFPY
jgi:hypothetical protein